MRVTRQDRVKNVDDYPWAGDNPYFLVINEGAVLGPVLRSWIVDLDERGWQKQRRGLMRAEGEWVLVAKRDHLTLYGNPVIALRVLPGEQPYYSRKHIGIAYPAGGEIVVHGIGKKRHDGHVDRLWIMPSGVIVGGDDAEIMVVRGLKIASQQPG